MEANCYFLTVCDAIKLNVWCPRALTLRMTSSWFSSFPMISISLSSTSSVTNLIFLDERDLAISSFIQILLFFARIYIRKLNSLKNKISGFFAASEMSSIWLLNPSYGSESLPQEPIIPLFSNPLNLNH